ncbi:T9SS type A sorting domain-containing protein [Saccharicrinis sp. FJH62]|uniref:T9SS type A sorting domain-containing protein n=1 Tax=Saccharicrinis sp. FJH62 TaxID=3344657 RepID=UPI0035D428C7
MKSMLLLTLFIFAHILVSAQNVFPTYADKPVWYELYTGSTYPARYTTEEIYYNKDTIIKNKLYNELNWNNDFIRIQDKKVYYRSKDNNRDFLMYDFGLNIGDTVYCRLFDEKNEYYPDTAVFWVNKIDSIATFEKNWKRFTMCYIPYPYPEDYESTVDTMYWIEGIGSTLHPFYSYGGVLNMGSKKELLCFSLDGQLIYQNPLYNRCNINTSILVTKGDKNIDLYVKHSSNILYFKHESEIKNVKIYDYSGHCITCREIFSPEEEINLEYLSPGIYLVVLSTTNNKIYHKKILLKQ